MKLVAYLRVSTTRQAEDGLGLEVQERAVRDWARDHGHQIVAIHKDEGVSGANGLDTRVGLVDALADLRKKRAGGMVVYRLDRLARDLVLQEQLLSEIWKMGAEAFTTAGGEAQYLHRDDPDDPSREFIRQVLSAVAKYEGKMIRLRLRAGRRRKAERGEYAYGAPPFGTRAKANELVADSDEAATVARILELHGAGCSLRQIATRLDEQGRRPKRGAQWHPATVDRVIKRHSPAGT